LLSTGLAAAGLLLAAHALAADCAVALGRVASVQGTVELRRAESTQWSVAAAEAELCSGDSLRVGERSREGNPDGRIRFGGPRAGERREVGASIRGGHADLRRGVGGNQLRELAGIRRQRGYPLHPLRRVRMLVQR